VPITTKVESSNPDHADTTLCDNVCQWLATGRWFLPGTLVSSINKTDHHDIIVILLKVALNTITLTLTLDFKQLFYMFFQNRKIKYLFMLCCKKIMNALLVYILLLGISNRYTIIYLLMEETRVPGRNHRPVASHWQTLSHNVVSAWAGFELSTLVVIGTYYACSCKSNYHTITTKTAPFNIKTREKFR
jgi:hypothetical protein